ncbi:MAG: murein L,D-transpeptidase catalytic domain family protein [Bacteroidales bacterium]
MGIRKAGNILRIFILLVLTGLSIQNTLPESHPENVDEGGRQSHLFDLSHISGILSKDLLESFQNRVGEYLPIAQNNIVTFIDFSLPGTERRLWTIDMVTGTILFNTFVAHGRNSGINHAERFSNIPQSYQSSLGFYLTDIPYTGKHGNSLRLKGLERNLNDRAWDRAIVVHGADYVSDSFIKMNGRLGRSHGCPAVPLDVTDELIRVIKNGSLMFIYHPKYKQVKG